MHIGKIIPLHVGSAGRVLMAWDDDALNEVLGSALAEFTDATVVDPDLLRSKVDETRRMGFAITSGERDEGATGVAAPVFDSHGHVLGALMISGPSFRFSPNSPNGGPTTSWGRRPGDADSGRPAALLRAGACRRYPAAGGRG